MDINPGSTQIDDEVLYKEFFTPVFRYIYFRTKDRDVANDLTQTSFLKFLRRGERNITKDHAIKLLFTITRNTLIDFWRVESKKSHENIEEINIPSTAPNPEESAISEQDKIFINEILDRLSDMEREVVAMKLSGDIDYEVIASTLGISIINARKIYSRAIQKVGMILKNNNNF